MPDLDFQGSCQEARSAVAKGDFAGARKHFERAVKLRPDSSDANYGLATICYLSKDHHTAVRYFEEVVKLDPLHAGAEINLGALYNLLGKYEEAVTHLRRGIQLDRSRSEGYYNLGIAYRKLGRSELAIQAYREAGHLNPRMVEAFYNLANVYFEMARYDQAVCYYHRAIEINPGFKKAEEGLRRADRKIQESRRPLDSGVIVTDPRAGSAIENDARLDRILGAEQDHSVLEHLYAESDQARKQCEQWLQHAEGLDQAVRGLALHLNPDASRREAELSYKQLLSAADRLRQIHQQFQKTVDNLGKLRDKMVENA